jgi:gliding motility-associated-like protein
MRIVKQQFQSPIGFWILSLIGLIPLLAFTSPKSVAVEDFSIYTPKHFFNTPPIAVDDTFSGNENQFLIFKPTLNDTLNGQLVSLSIQTLPRHGTIGFSAAETLVYKPHPSFCGKDTLFYVIANETFAFDTAMVVLTVNCGEHLATQAPIALDDVFSVYKNTPLNLIVLENDSLNGDLVSPLSIVQQPKQGTASVLLINTISYSPKNDFCGGYDTLSYAVCNKNGCDTATAIIYVHCTVDNTNANQPIAVDDYFSTKRSAFHVFVPTLNDTLKGTLLSTSIIKNCNNGSVGFVGIDTLVYMAQKGFCGRDTLSYRVCNTLFLCATASVFIDVECTKDDSSTLTLLPKAVDDNATTLEGKSVTIPILTNDTLNGIMMDPLRIVRLPNRGFASIVVNDLMYTPFNGFCNGYDTISYKICNGLGCDTAYVFVWVACDSQTITKVPIVKNDNIVTNRNRSLKFNPTINDMINGTLSTLDIVSTPRHGYISATTAIDTLLYTPDFNYCGFDTLEYRICRTDLKCDTGFIFITINCTPLGERPDAIPDVATVVKNNTVSIRVLNNDAFNGALSAPLSMVSQPLHGTVGIDNQNHINYTPDVDFCGQKDSFSYKICNLNGCDTAVVVVDILCVNPNHPKAKDDAAIILQGKIVEINVVANDTLNGILDSITILNGPKNAVATIKNNNILYASNAVFCGGYDTLTYSICTIGGCDTALLVVSVLCDTVKNLTPVAQNDVVETMQGRSVLVNILKNDTLFSEPLENFTITLAPRHGIASFDTLQNINYTPALSFCNGLDTITYAICTRWGCDTASAIINVICDRTINMPPVANSDRAVTKRAVGLMIPILANDSLMGADTVRLKQFAKHGTASFDASTNKLFYEPDAIFCGGFDSLVYEICNFKGCDTALVVIAVGCDSVSLIKPIANFDTARVEINKSVVINILKNDSLNQFILLETSVQPKHGLVSYGNNMATYVPINEFWGRDTFVYILCNLAGCDTAKVYIMVHAGNNMEVYNGFSPNGDGMNDRLIIRGIENYPNNEVIIYNRWGNEIFKRKGYSNDDGWAGDWSGQIVLDGTYFYTIYLNDEKKQVKTGYIQVHR